MGTAWRCKTIIKRHERKKRYGGQAAGNKLGREQTKAII